MRVRRTRRAWTRRIAALVAALAAATLVWTHVRVEKLFERRAASLRERSLPTGVRLVAESPAVWTAFGASTWWEVELDGLDFNAYADHLEEHVPELSPGTREVGRILLVATDTGDWYTFEAAHVASSARVRLTFCGGAR